MADLRDLLVLDAVNERLPVSTKKAALQQIGVLAATAYAQDAATVMRRLLEREKLGSTGYGGGTAIPHARMPGLEHVLGVFVRLASPIEYGAIDDLPVDLVFALLSPSDAGPQHLKALARVSRMLRDAALLARLRGAGSRDALFAVLTAGEARDAA